MILTAGNWTFMALTLVLSIGLDSELLSTRNLVLQSAGYTVVAAISLKEAVDRFRDGDFDTVLLCHSVPAKEKDRLTSWIRASGSRIPVVSVSGGPCQCDTLTDATVESNPTSLLKGMREALIKAAMQAPPASTFRDKQNLARIQEKKSPESSAGYEPQTSTIKEHLVPLARAG